MEEAANVSLDGRDPYAADYRDGPLSDRPRATQVHFPYLPGMLVSVSHGRWWATSSGRMLACGSRSSRSR